MPSQQAFPRNVLPSAAAVAGSPAAMPSLSLPQMPSTEIRGIMHGLDADELMDDAISRLPADASYSALTAPSMPLPAVAPDAYSSSLLPPSENVLAVASIMPSTSVLHHPTLPPAGGLSLNLSEQNVSQILQRTNARRGQPAPSHPSTPFGQAPSQPASNYAAPSQQRQLDFDDKLRSLMAERDELITRLMHINGIPEETIHGGNKANRTKNINKFNRRINEIDDTLARINSTRSDSSISSQHGSGMVMPSQQRMVAGPSSLHPSHPSPSFGNSRDGHSMRQPLQTASGALHHPSQGHQPTNSFIRPSTQTPSLHLSEQNLSQIMQSANARRLQPAVGPSSTYQLAPLPPSVHLAQSSPPRQLQTSAHQPAADPFGHLDLGATIDYAEQASIRQNLLQIERDRLLNATVHPTTELRQIENLDQQINSTNVIIQSLIARAEQLSQRNAGPAFRQNIASAYAYGQPSQQNIGHMVQQIPSGQNIQTMPSNQVYQSQLYNLPSASRHGNYSGQSAGVSIHGAGGLVPQSNIIGSPSEQWRNADPSGIVRGTQASVGHQSFNSQQPFHRADASFPTASADQPTIRAPSTIRAHSTIRPPSASGKHSAGSSGQNYNV